MVNKYLVEIIILNKNLFFRLAFHSNLKFYQWMVKSNYNQNMMWSLRKTMKNGIQMMRIQIHRIHPMMITLIQVKILIDTSGYTSDYILIIFIIILSMYIIFTRIVMYLFIYNSIIFQNLTFLKKESQLTLIK